MLKKLPLWLKIFFILIGLMIFGPMLVPFKELLLPLILLVLVFYPGPDLERPRLVRLAPYLWILSFFSAAVLLLVKSFSKMSLPPEMDSISNLEIGMALLSSPVLLLLYLKEHVFFKRALLITYIGMLGIAFYDVTIQNRSLLDFVGNLITESILTFYLLKKMRLPF